MKPTRSVATPPPGTELLRVAGLAKAYDDGRGVADISLHLNAREVLGFVGPNGAGKTTTLRMLAGLLQPDAGSGVVMGQRIGKMSRGASSVGYLPQKLALYDDLTVTDNLRFRADIYCLPTPAAHVERALQAFGLADRAQQRARYLSGGWARRLQFAAALIHDPAVILLDEPTAGLDGQSREEVWQHIQSLADGGAGVIVNTHDLAEAERCSRVALFRAGRIVQHGSPAQISAAAAVRAALVQFASSESLHGILAGDPSVLSLTPHGRRSRLLVRAEAFDAIFARLAAGGATLTSDETRLADVALLNEEGASGWGGPA